MEKCGANRFDSLAAAPITEKEKQVRRGLFDLCVSVSCIYLFSLLLFQLSYSISESFAFLISVERSSFLR